MPISRQDHEYFYGREASDGFEAREPGLFGTMTKYRSVKSACFIHVKCNPLNRSIVKWDTNIYANISGIRAQTLPQVLLLLDPMTMVTRIVARFPTVSKHGGKSLTAGSSRSSLRLVDPKHLRNHCQYTSVHCIYLTTIRV